MIPNYFPKDEWIKIVTETLICFGGYKNLKLDEDSWLKLFEEKLHPLAAIAESEGIMPLACFYEVSMKYKERKHK